MSPRRPQQEKTAGILAEMARQLEAVRAADTHAPLRIRVLGVVRLRQLLSDYGASLLTARSARGRVREYLVEHVGTVISSEELAAVAGIHEFGRRIRELRVEEGYNIQSGVGREDLSTDEYVLVEADPRPEVAARWSKANGIRRRGGSAKDRILEYLQEHVAVPVDGEELAYVARIEEWARRVRELRNEDGWVIHTQSLGRPDLKAGQYVLESLQQEEPHERSIPEEVAEAVYARDRYRCVRCGWSQAAWTAGDTRYLNLHHIRPHVEGGDQTPANLEVRCSVCHRQAHTA